MDKQGWDILLGDIREMKVDIKSLLESRGKITGLLLGAAFIAGALGSLFFELTK